MSLRERLATLLPARGSRALALAFVLLLAAPFLPRVPLPRTVYQSLVVIDITQSMDVPDHAVGGRPASRIAFARDAIRRALPALPCGSRVGLGIFAEYRTLVLVTPVEVCDNHADLLATLERIDGTMRWGNASEVTKAVFWGMRAVRDTNTGAQLVFVTDGHEAPPLNRVLPIFDDLASGAPKGTIVGVGGDAPQPIPRSDRWGRAIGLWRADDVVQTPGVSAEHLSQLREPHLQALARQIGFGYARWQAPQDARPVLMDARAAKRMVVPTDLRAVPLGLALALLCASFLPAGLGARLRRVAAGVPLLGGLVALPAQAQQAVEVAPGAWHLQGTVAPWGSEAAGAVSNSGFVVGERCIAAIDAGGSPTAAKALLAQIRKVSGKPVCFVVSTHVHPDHVMGTDAFAAANGGAPPPRRVGHAKLAASLAARLPFYLRAMQRDFAPEDRASAVAAPDLTVADRLELDLGGRTIELRAWPTAHTDADLTVLDRGSNTLWTGDLVFDQHLPVLDGKLVGWRKVLKDLRAIPATRAVPGHGAPLAWPDGASATEAYLATLEADVRQSLKANAGLAKTVERLGAQPQPGWKLAEDFHKRNVTAAFAELEWAE